ncbi:MAG: acylphosphatase [Candidatus Limnocylindria bacterium]
MSAEPERLTATAIGDVQGVGFRYWTLRRARSLAVTGWVRNRADGRAVELVAEGTREALDELERLLRRGPPGSVVERVESRRDPAVGGFEGFAIARDTGR